MTRHGLFAILALTGVLTIPDPAFARPSFRPAFTTGPFRIVLPTGRPHFSGGPRIHAIARPAMHKPAHPVVRTTAAGPAPFRLHRRGFRGSLYPVTVGTDSSYYGTPYDPSDIPVYAPLASVDDPSIAAATPPIPSAVADERGCRAQRVLVQNKYGAESEVTIVRC